jgi:hypothetical protein
MDGMALLIIDSAGDRESFYGLLSTRAASNKSKVP